MQIHSTCCSHRTGVLARPFHALARRLSCALSPPLLLCFCVSVQQRRRRAPARPAWWPWTAWCLVVCCCCPCLVLQVTVFLLVRLPRKVVVNTNRIILRRWHRRRPPASSNAAAGLKLADLLYLDDDGFGAAFGVGEEDGGGKNIVTPAIPQLSSKQKIISNAVCLVPLPKTLTSSQHSPDSLVLQVGREFSSSLQYSPLSIAAILDSSGLNYENKVHFSTSTTPTRLQHTP
jgi:hypothetical protein